MHTVSMRTLPPSPWWVQVPVGRRLDTSWNHRTPWLGAWGSTAASCSAQERMDLLLAHMYSAPIAAEDVCPRGLCTPAPPFLPAPQARGVVSVEEFFGTWRSWLGFFGSQPAPARWISPQLFPLLPRSRPWALLGGRRFQIPALFGRMAGSPREQSGLGHCLL